jgi:hypothetical protein
MQVQHLTYLIYTDSSLFHKVRQEYMKDFEADHCKTRMFEAFDKIKVYKNENFNFCFL